MLYSLSRRCFSISLILFAVGAQNTALSQTRITPTLGLEGSFVSNKTATLDESGQVTTISPGVRYEAMGANTTVVLDYSINAIYASGLVQEDEVDQLLDFNASIAHIPNRWITQFNSSISHTNVSPDGIQIGNPNIKSSNSQELKALDVSSALNGRASDNIDYNTRLSADYAGFEDSPSTDGAALIMGLSSRGTQKIQWSSSLRSSVSSTEGNSAGDEQIDTFQAEISYQLNPHYSTFLSYKKSDTDNQFLNDPNTTVGVTWTPSRLSSLKLGIGERSDEPTYLIESFITTRRVTYTLNYDESVSTSRDLLINDSTNPQDFAPSSQSIETAPAYIKQGRAEIIMTGVRTNLTFAYFNRKTSRTDNNSNEELTEGVSIDARRTLSQSSSVSASISREETEATQINNVTDASISYDRQQTKKITWSAEIRSTKQESNVITSESEQSSINFRGTFSF
jgi:hypothetical protein